MTANTAVKKAVEQAVEKATRFRAPITGEVPDEMPATPAWVKAMQAWVPNQKWRQDLQVKHAVQGLIRAGKVGALVAAGGTGKTTMLLMLAICHATQRKFLGLEVTHGTFVLISADDPQEDLEMALKLVVEAMKLTEDEINKVASKVRLHSLQGEPGTKTFTTSATGTVVSTGLEALVTQAVGEIPDLVGIAIDTLRQFSGGNSNDEQVIKLTIAGATEIARQTGAYVILPHHTGKQNFRDGVADMYCGSGSAAIADNCRFVLLLQTTTWSDIESKVQRTGQERGDPLVLLSTRGSLLMKSAEPIFLHRDGYYIERVAGAVLSKDQQADERDRDVLRAVRHGAQTKTTIARAVKSKKSAALARVDDLELRGLLANSSPSGSHNHPRYTLTQAGVRFLEIG
jgi:RecA-family ATPase